MNPTRKKSLLVQCFFWLFVAVSSLHADFKKVVGAWDLWIPGAVLYEEKDGRTNQVISAGVSMNRLIIQADGSYEWGKMKGKLEKVKPWHALDGREYYAIKDIRGNAYDFWYQTEKDQLIVLFGEVGGHAATASRPEKEKSESSKSKK